MTGELLTASGVRVEFSTRGGSVARALDGADLQLSPGEVVALVGESGSGKTTLARTLLGLERPTEGEVRFGGRPSPNLFVAGEMMAGNVLGQGYTAGVGMSIGTAFGRIAGTQAARFALNGRRSTEATLATAH